MRSGCSPGTLRGACIALLACALAGCAARETPVPPAGATPLQAGGSVGQTFVARRQGLNSIEVFLLPGETGPGQLQLRLRADPLASADLAAAGLPLAQVTGPAYYRFTFAPQADSYQRYYYAELTLAGAGSVQVGAHPGATYLDGAQYAAGGPLDAQSAFRLGYAPAYLFADAARTLALWGGMLGLTVLLFVLPGAALLGLLWPRSGLSWAEAAGLGAGLSLALYPVLLLWTGLINLRLGPLYAWLPALGGAAVLAWRAWQARRQGVRWTAAPWRAWRASPGFWPDAALLAALALTFAVRFWVIRAVEAPMWGDSVHHTMIARLIVDHGGLFSNWQPYADLESLTYHFGFHSAAAALHWVTGLPLHRAVLWTGQIVNGLAVLALYPLVTRLGGSRWAGVAAVLGAGLLFPMPMFYVNWSRYTQLAGQAILPGAACLILAALDGERPAWGRVGLACLALAGLALTHYRIVILAAVFFGLVILWRLAQGRLRALLRPAPALAGGACLLFLPWFVNMFAGRTLSTFGRQLSTPPEAASAWVQSYNAVPAGDWSIFIPAWAWLALPAAVGWGLWRRERGAALVAGWWLLNLVAANPHWLGLPGQGAIASFTIFIGAYIPAAVLLGLAFGWAVQRAGRPARAALLLAAGALALWGVSVRPADVRVAEHALVTRPDLRAAAWIEHNLPRDARFLTNSFFAYNDVIIVGSDAGWWLPLLAGRAVTLPPMVYGSERGPWPDYRAWVNTLARAVREDGPHAPETLALLAERGVTHVYLGQRQGRVNYAGPVLEPADLLAGPAYRLVYHQDRVWIFEVLPAG